MRRNLKTLVALAATTAILILTAAPGAAQSGTITSGHLIINLTPAYTDTLPGADPSCASNLDLDFPSSLTSGTGNLSLKLPFQWTTSYVIEIPATAIHVNSSYATTGVNASKHLVTLGSSTGTGFTAIDANVYFSTGTGSCTRSSTTPRCSNMDVNFPVVTGIFTGTVTHGTTSQHTLDGTLHFNTNIVATFVAAGCAPPFSAFNGKTATFSSLTIDY